MSEEPTGTTTETTAQAAGEKPAAEPTTAPSEGRTYTQADVDNITGKVKTNLEAQLAKAQAEADKLRKQNETEQEKAIREAKESARAEMAGELKAARLDAALNALGLEGPKLKAALAAAPDEWENVSDAIKGIQEGLPELFTKSKPFGGGNGPSAKPAEADWTPERINSVIASGQYEKYRDEIKAAQSRKRGDTAPPIRYPSR